MAADIRYLVLGIFTLAAGVYLLLFKYGFIGKDFKIVQHEYNDGVLGLFAVFMGLAILAFSLGLFQ